MNPELVLNIQLLASLVVYTVVAVVYVWPKVSRMALEHGLVPLLFVHTVRHVGLISLVPMLADPLLPASFTIPQAYGDFVSMVLALVAILALTRSVRVGRVFTWIFSVVGITDLLYAFYEGARVGVGAYDLNFFWFLLVFVVPALLVTHVMIVMLLVKNYRSV